MFVLYFVFVLAFALARLALALARLAFALAFVLFVLPVAQPLPLSSVADHPLVCLFLHVFSSLSRIVSIDSTPRTVPLNLLILTVQRRQVHRHKLGVPTG